MYALPSAPTVRDIIRRSLVCHPSMLADMLEQARRAHADAAATLAYSPSEKTAKALALACFNARRWALELSADDALERILAQGLAEWIPAFSAAAKLQCLPHHVQREAVERA